MHTSGTRCHIVLSHTACCHRGLPLVISLSTSHFIVAGLQFACLLVSQVYLMICLLHPPTPLSLTRCSECLERWRPTPCPADTHTNEVSCVEDFFFFFPYQGIPTAAEQMMSSHPLLTSVVVFEMLGNQQCAHITPHPCIITTSSRL